MFLFDFREKLILKYTGLCAPGPFVIDAIDKQLPDHLKISSYHILRDKTWQHTHICFYYSERQRLHE